MAGTHCPFLDRNCLQDKCKLWNFANNDCVIPEIWSTLEDIQITIENLPESLKKT